MKASAFAPIVAHFPDAYIESGRDEIWLTGVPEDTEHSAALDEAGWFWSPDVECWTHNC